MQQIEKTINEVEKLNPDLARELRRYVRDHSYGLVYEQNLPENVRLYTKKAAAGDSVNIRPPRGSNETEENKVIWKVRSINPDGTAEIVRGEQKRQIAAEDLVPVISWKDTIYPGLKEVDRIERGDPDDPYQVVINGENYHALEMLLYCYPGKVDCIYIDPPYNTGAKDWKYNNNYVDTNDKYRHSKWLSFMERRLKLAKRLLKPDNSVLIITIDEKEYLRLGQLLEQMFPEADIEMITSVINARGKQRVGKFARTEEYIFFVKFGNATVHLEDDNDYLKGSEVPWRTMRRSNLAGARGKHGAGACGPNQFYPVYVNDNGVIVGIGKSLPENESITNVKTDPGITAVFPIRDDGTEMNWGITENLAHDLLKKGYIRVGKHKPNKPQKWELSYLTSGKVADIETGKAKVVGKNKDGSVQAVYVQNKKKAPTSVWVKPTHNAETEGTMLLKSIFVNKSRFTYPKSLYAVRDSLALFIDDKPDALVVDFFAGSGTTLHAVNLLNAEDGGHRRCIAITNNEISSEEISEFTRNGYRQGEPEWEAKGIAQYITWPRTKCSIKGENILGEPLDGKYYGSEIPLSKGFETNAIFFNLTYESLLPICLDSAFDAISPILWMQAGCRGPIIDRTGKSFLTTPYYAVLFDYNQASKFCQKVKNTPTIQHAYVVTDDQRRYSNICKRLPGISVHRLYESYIKTFEICAEGGLD